MLNSKNRIKGCRNRPKEISRQTCLRIFKILENLTNWLSEDTSSAARMRYVIHNIFEKTDKCPICNNRLKYSSKNMKFELTCGLKDNDHLNYIQEETQRLAKESQLEKYGGWAAQTEEFKKKVTSTNLQKYGVSRYSQTEEFKQKMRQEKEEYLQKRTKTNLEKYGYEFASQHPDIKLKNIQRSKEALKKKYGVDHFTKWEGYPKYLEENKHYIISKMKKTNIEKYGAEFVPLSEHHKNLMLARYGVENYTQTEEYKHYMRENWPKISEKIKRTNLERYGTENYFQSDVFKKHLKENWPSISEKIRRTNLEKYGVEYYSQTEEYRQLMREKYPNILEKIKKTSLKKYGVEHYTKSDEFKKLWEQNKDKYMQRAKASNLEKYGVEFYSQTEEFKEKTKASNLEKYGVEFYSQTEEFKLSRDNIIKKIQKRSFIDYEDNITELSKEFLIKEFLTEKGYFDINKFMQNYECGETTAYRVMREYDIKYKKRQGTSLAEEEITKFIKELDPDAVIETNTKQVISPKELDIYLPEYNLAIEYNGLMFHSQGVSDFSMFNTPNKNKKLHLEKTEACEVKGIQLLHIFENEWLDSNLRQIWKSVIRNKLGKNSNRLMARKCEIRELTSKKDLKLSSDFFDENHLQGAKALGGIRIGLFYNDELVSCMTFGQSRFHKEKVYELIRFANKQDTTVMGAASKLFKYFVRLKNPKKIISYANRRWSDGGLYRQLKFKELHKTEPNYFYFKPGMNTLWSRNVFQKHKLKDKLPIFNEELTESENMFNNGYRRIYDSGNYSFLWESEENGG